MNEKLSKTPKESEVEMTELVLPNDTNLLGNLLGGRLMHWIDIAAAMAASRHSNKVVATRVMEQINFKIPIHMGDIVILKARLIWTGRTSMRVLVKVFREDLKNGEKILTNEAFLTFVALDEEKLPAVVPALLPETEEEIALFQKEEEKRKK